jgi:hypothetical protein
MSNETPPLWALDMAAEAAGYAGWAEVVSMHGGRVSGAYASVEAHAHTLAKYEKPPVDEAELKRRQDAREFAARAYDRLAIEGDAGWNSRRADDLRTARTVADKVAFAIYDYACHRDGTTPVPVEEWGK